MSAWRRHRKRRNFPLGCAIVLYASKGLRPTGKALGYTYQAVQYRLRQAGIQLRPTGTAKGA
jgi:hypothetical protein